MNRISTFITLVVLAAACGMPLGASAAIPASTATSPVTGGSTAVASTPTVEDLSASVTGVRGAWGDSAADQAKSSTANCDAASSASGGGIGSRLVGAAINKACGNGSTGYACQALLNGSAGGAVSELCGGGAECNLIGGILNNSSIGEGINSNVTGIMDQFSGGINQGAGGLQDMLSGGVDKVASLFGFGSGGGSGMDETVSVTGKIGGLLGGSGGGSGVSDVAGGLGGAMSVPVNDSATQGKIDAAKSAINSKQDVGNKELAQIRKDQDKQLEVTCVINPTVRKARQKILLALTNQAVQYGATGGIDGTTIWWSGPSSDLRRQDIIAKTYINDLASKYVSKDVASGVQQDLATQYSSGKSLQQQLKCDIPDAEACRQSVDKCAGSTAQEKWRTLMNIQSVQIQCTKSGAKAVLGGAMNQRISESDAEVLQQRTEGQGYLPNIVCTDGTTDKETCYATGHYKEVTPGITQKDTLTQRLESGPRQEESANEMGALVDSLFVQLGTRALTSLSGLIGLTENTNGEGSYVNQMSGSSAASTLASDRSDLQAQIEDSMGIEASYESIINDNIANLTTARTATLSLQTCYAALATSTSATIGSQAATQKMNVASSTIATILAPQIGPQKKLLSDSESALIQLNNLDDLIQAASTQDDVSSIKTAYQALSSSGALHSASVVASAAADRDSSKTTLAAITANANSSLADCKAGK